MKTLSFNVEKTMCAECGLAVRRFIGGMDGVQGIDVADGSIQINFDENTIPEEKVRSLTRDSVSRLGYRIDE